MHRIPRLIVLCLGLLIAWALIASSATAATNARWAIEGKTMTAQGIAEETTSIPEKPMKLISAGWSLEISCTINGEGKIIAGVKGLVTLKLFACTSNFKFCKVAEPILITKAPTELTENKATGALYEVVKPTEKLLTTLKFSNEACALPESMKITGELAGQLQGSQVTEQTLTFSQAISEAAGTSLLFGTKAGSFSGTAIQKLSGAKLNKKWGACAACDYTSEESLGGSNPADPNFCKICAGDPIDAATGNLTEEQVDIDTLGGRGPALGVTRSYNAQLAAVQTESGAFGFGWTGPYSAHLVLNETAKTATVYQDNGSDVVFYLNAGVYAPAPWMQSKLVKEGTNYIYTLPDQSKLEFNSSGQLIKESDRHKNALTFTYKSNQLETVKDAAGRALTFTFKEGHVESIKDPIGNVVTYAYESGNLTKVTLPGAAAPRWTFKYDASHRLTEVTDGRSHAIKNEYDGSNRVTLQTDRMERKTKLEYAVTGGVKETTITEPNGSKTLEKFNEAGEPTSITRALGTGLAATTTVEYDNALNRIAVTDPNGHTTKLGYDAEGNKTSEKDANENETTWVYNSTHDLTKKTTPKGETTTITRNAAGDPEFIKRPAPGATTQETKFEYAENGDLKSETDPLGHKTSFTYDTYGNRASSTNAAEDKTTWTYNEDGRETATVSPRGNEAGATAAEFETKIERDAQGRPTKTTDPLGHETKYGYDANGNLEKQTDPNGRTTTFVYDADDERTEVKAPNGNVAKTAYDSEGKVSSKTDGNGHTTKYERDALEHLTETIDPLLHKTIRKYYAAGNLKELTDPAGRTATYTYDPGDRLKEVKYSEEATKPVTFTYDQDGNVTEMKDGTGTTKNTYDELDRLTESKNGASEVVKYEYNLGGQTTKITYPNTKSITRAFDAAGRLEKVTDWLGKETKFAYNRDSAQTMATFPATSGNVDEYEFNHADQLTKTTMKKGAEAPVSISYTRDSAGQLKTSTQKGLPGAEKLEYGYDEDERMTSGAGGSYAYDAANSPTEVAGSVLKYNEASQLTKAGTTEYTFDTLGERTEAKPSAGPATKYGYDQAQNLISVKRAEEGAIKKIEDSYAYDGNGLRASQTINGSKTQLAWDTAEELPLLLSDGTNSYLYGPEGLPFEQIASETATYLHHDQQGSTRLLTNTTGETKGTYTYTPYGATEGYVGTATTPLGYDGQYASEDTGLIYLRARTYDPSTAQFMSVDPRVAETGEAYGYTAGNPMNADDPSGELFGGTYSTGGSQFHLGPINIGIGPTSGSYFYCPLAAAYYAFYASLTQVWISYFAAHAAAWNAVTAYWNNIAAGFNQGAPPPLNLDGVDLDAQPPGA